MTRINPRLWLALAIICMAITYICVNWGCRTVKRNKSISEKQSDSFYHLRTLGVKLTEISESITKPYVFNPGDFAGYFRMEDTAAQEFETDLYKVSVTPGKGKQGSIKVTGKQKILEVPVQKQTSVIETGAADLQGRSSKTEKQFTASKDVSAIPFWFWCLLILAGICLVLLLTNRGLRR